MNATDRIDYTRPFAEQVEGTLYARFRLDADGVPIYEVWGGDRFYTIDVYLLSPKAAGIDEVTYFFDDSASPEPLGSSADRANDFRATIDSPGDARLRVEVRIGDSVYEQRAWLSQMLENGYAKGATPAVRSAILHIKVS
ncbi:MAG: hypothetical protein J0I06_12365 [Planctomycetes bacterium]|nr:hypothetical protein [Planctomycetota bacterium]